MFKPLSGSSGNVIGFKIGEDITAEDVDDMSKLISEVIGACGKVRLLLEIEGFRHMEQEDLLAKLRFAVDHESAIERTAVLSNRVWIKSWVKVGGFLNSTEIEHFDRHDAEAAWNWIRA